ncbi:DUF4340 domain-containing protein [Alteromonas sediminis]|uniref:DUF4340 domain-containing protein n=1 Tax=Alteromonas sediminis TaxID=2259342 RepID=A0A3N5XXS6_9ALTE|nr:DUF4340 domain-containing protein [Alteromonas sediminis]RPJ65642.1 DUF4340 domain-containing protein [Alteromonas sediminis]
MKRLLTLLVLLVIVVGINMMIASAPDESSVIEEKPLLGQLLENAEQLTSIRIETVNGIALEASLKGQQWQAEHLDEQDDFPVDEAALRELVSELASAKVVEDKSSNPDNFARLGLAALSSPESAATKVTLQTPGKQWSLLLGTVSAQGTGQFVRLPSENQTYLSDTRFSLPTAQSDWLVNPALSLDSLDILSINAQGPVNWRIKREGDAQEWMLENLQDNQKLAFQDVLADLGQEFAQINFENVLNRNATQLAWLTDSPFARFTLELADNVIMLNLYRQEGTESAWLTIDSQNPIWQSKWAYQLSQFEQNKLLVTRDSLIQSPGEDAPANP